MKKSNRWTEFLQGLKDKFPKSRGKGSTKSETATYNHPRRDKQVRSGKK